MKQNVQGIPSTITVDGKTYGVRYYGRWFKVNLNEKTTVEVAKFTELADRIRQEEAHLASEREYARQDRAAKRAQEKKMPLVLARLRGTNEVVQVRGKSTRGRWNDKYLVTLADGSKDTVSGYALISMSSDEATLAQIKADETVLRTEVTPLTKAGSLDAILTTLRMATLDVIYDVESDTFTGTYGDLSVTAINPPAVEAEIVRQAIAQERPWTTVTEDRVTTVADILKTEKARYASYDKAWADKADAERYATLQNQLVALSEKRTLASEGFNYDAEVAAAQASV